MTSRPIPTFAEVRSARGKAAGGKKRAQAMREATGYVDPANHKPLNFGLKRSPERESVAVYLGKDMICPQCSKEFLRPTYKWAYKIGDTFYCSYKCMRIVERGGA